MKRIWAIHFTGLIAMVGWSATDPVFEAMIRSRSLVDAITVVGGVRIVAFIVIALVSVTSLLVLCVQLFGRSQASSQTRSLRQLFMITTVIALWCSLSLYHDAIAWQGKRARFAWRVDEFEAIALPLRDGWPQRDGELPELGPFMAYPFGRPTTLILLQSPQLASRSAYVSSIQRCSTGAIKLRLTGIDGGDWAEWHPPHSHPDSFIGGLADPHQLRSAATLGGGWYLVRYET